jgi:teichuronic acid biosynthesis glycosyltransferase TuaC
MRIAVVTTSWPADGGDPAGHFVRTEARALERSGHEVVVVTPRPGGAFGWPGVAARVRARPARAIGAMGWVLAARTRLRRMGVDRIVAHWAVPSAWPIAVAAPEAAIDAVSHGGDVRLLAALPMAARRRAVEAVASRVERWRFVSEALLDDLLRTIDGPLRARVERVAAIEPAMLEVPELGHLVAERRRALGRLRIAVSVGRLVATKRVDRAIERAARMGDIDALVVVGDGPERPRLERLAGASRVDTRFVGIVPREEALAWIGAADVLLHASEAEGMSTVVREAEALGTPVVRI